MFHDLEDKDVFKKQFVHAIFVYSQYYLVQLDCIKVTNTTISVIKQRHVTHVVMVLLLM